MTDILVFGYGGQVATELRRFSGITALGRGDADLSDPATCVAAIEAHRPDAVINAAAFTAVDAAEKEEPLANVVNGESPAAMAQVCASMNIPLVHISTDYVLAGSGTRPWSPEDPPAPQNAYGRSKLAGELGVRAAGGAHAILRTSWVFSAHGGNFVETMLRVAQNRDEISVVNDQQGGPTAARDIAAACLIVIEQLVKDSSKSGTYHFSGWPDVSWCDFAVAIFAQANLDIRVQGIPTRDYPTPATRPTNSRMDCQKTEEVFAIPRPAWRAGLAETLTELGVIT